MMFAFLGSSANLAPADVGPLATEEGIAEPPVDGATDGAGVAGAEGVGAVGAADVGAEVVAGVAGGVAGFGGGIAASFFSTSLRAENSCQSLNNS